MRRHLIFTALVGLLLVGAAFPAFAAKTSNMSVPAGCNPTTTTGCLGKACDTTGLTVMDIDQKRILACLKNDSGAKVWK
ncbi:MAG: hypothetical protein HGA90_07105, partial [Alphaproteobacteria bacterium]|nr:hypothetical protein [Alphaproteobacteria bacterium]